MKIGYEAKRIYHNKTGLGNYSRDLIRILATHFPKNTYFLYNPKPKKDNNLFQFASENIIQRNPRSKIHKEFKNYWRQKGVVADLITDKIDIFHGLSGEIPFGLHKKGIKSIVTIHDLIFMRYPELYSFLDRQIHYYKFKKAAQNADLVIAISEQTKQDIVYYLQIPPDKIKVIYQGCQDVFKATYSDNQKEIVKRKFNLPNQFILNVGTIEKRKNALTIVKAINGIDTHLVLIGKKTEYSKEIESYIATHKLEHKVTFLKGVSSAELAIIYQLATIFVYPSIFEGFGIPIIEALFSRTPVITTNSGVFPEAAGPYSLYCDPMNEVEMSKKIEYLLNNPEICKEISEKSHVFVQKFNDVEIANQLTQTYTEVLEKK